MSGPLLTLTTPRNPDGTFSSCPYVTDRAGRYVCSGFKDEISHRALEDVVSAANLYPQLRDVLKALVSEVERCEAEGWMNGRVDLALQIARTVIGRVTEAESPSCRCGDMTLARPAIPPETKGPPCARCGLPYRGTPMAEVVPAANSMAEALGPVVQVPESDRDPVEYRFDVGDSNHGPCGFVAYVYGTSPETALSKLRDEIDVDGYAVRDQDGTVIRVYLNADNVTVDDAELTGE